MSPSPLGAIVELVLGLAFLTTAVASLRRHHDRPDVHAGLCATLYLVVDTAALADAASAPVAGGPARALVWAGVVAVMLGGALVLLIQRNRRHRVTQ